VGVRHSVLLPLLYLGVLGCSPRCSKTLLADVLVRRSGFKVSDVAAYLARDATTISSLVSRFAEKIGKDLEMQKQAGRLAQLFRCRKPDPVPVSDPIQVSADP